MVTPKRYTEKIITIYNPEDIVKYTNNFGLICFKHRLAGEIVGSFAQLKEVASSNDVMGAIIYGKGDEKIFIEYAKYLVACGHRVLWVYTKTNPEIKEVKTFFSPPRQRHSPKDFLAVWDSMFVMDSA